MPQIDYFLFTLSPFCYLAGARLETIAADHRTAVAYRPFDLITVFKETGTPMPKDRHPSRQAYRLQELRRIADRQGLSINLRPAHWPTDPSPSCLAIIAAARTGGGNLGGLTHAILRACWAEERDIARPEVLSDCLRQNGYAETLLETVSQDDSDTFQKNTQEALQRGVFGAPSYLIDDQVFWGQDRLVYLDSWLAGRV